MPCDSVKTKNPAAPSCADSVVRREKSGLSCLSCSVLRTPIMQARARAADDAQRAARVDVAGG